MKTYRWVPDIPALKVLCVDRPEIIPLIRPNEASRLKRWNQILSWYGAVVDGQPGESAQKSIRVASAPANSSGDVIAALDENCRAVASVLAIADGRPLIGSSDISEIVEHAETSQATSLLLFAHPSQLQNRRLLELSASLSIPWGIITGRDLPALSFAIAKLFAARNKSQLSRMHLDAIERKKWSWSANGRERIGQLDTETTWQTLRDSDWDTISIHCHGDGAHANFNSVVLCGVADEEETGIGGWRGRCNLNNGSFHCKRVHHDQKRPFRFGDLRSRRVCLFTCNGFSVAGDVYPSDNSFILSAIEGYPSAVLTTDRRLRFDPWLFLAVPSLLEQEDHLGILSTVLNDLALRAEGVRPYLLYGDPAAGKPRRGERSSKSVFARPLNDLAQCSVIGVDQSNSDLILQRGALTGLVINGTSSVKLVDRNRDLESLRSWLIVLGLRLWRAQRTCSALRHHHAAAVSGETPTAELYAELTAILEQIELAADEGARLISEMEEKGVWTSAVGAWRAHVLLLTRLWDHQFAAFLDEHLLESDLQDILRDGFFRTTKSTAQRCPRCGCRTIKGTSQAPLLRIRHQWTECPTCGPREAHDHGLPRLKATLPNAMRPGDTIPLTVKWDPPFESPLDDTGLGILVTHLKDSGRGKVSYRMVEQVRTPPHSINIPVAADSALEIHTVRLALVRDLNVSYLRLRIPCIGSVR